ncbi:glycerol-3-phosphate 1-O-acyltransferase PlsY [Zwartia sp.]|uniref:glycerol-3-phosphate 1-O-acyltransferase PlsY n=1 Tax=Zwartia sp. TaxID=2978004 RepID=UPI003BB1FA17
MDIPQNTLSLLGMLLTAYLIGSVSFAVVFSKLFGLQDPRTYGSGNPGATNVLRSGNKAAAALTLIGDAAKGWFAVWMAQRLELSPLVIACVAIAVFIGHLYPIFLRFKGGKGVATAFGVMLAVQPLLALAATATWVIIAVFFRFSSLAALTCAVFAPFYYFFGGMLVWQAHLPIGVALITIAIFLLYRHKANIQRLLNGTEPRIGQGKKT